MFVPYPQYSYPSADEIAKAILDEKERRDREKLERELFEKKKARDEEEAAKAAEDIISMLMEEGDDLS